MYSYKDFVTGKVRRTNGVFINWSEPTGLLHMRYAIFRRRCTILAVPVYLLTKETRALLPPYEESET